MSTYRDLLKYSHKDLQQYTHFIIQNGIVIPIEAVASMGAFTQLKAKGILLDISADVVRIHGEAYIQLASSLRAKSTKVYTAKQTITNQSKLAANTNIYNKPTPTISIKTNFKATPKLVEVLLKKADIDIQTGVIANPLIAVSLVSNITNSTTTKGEFYYIDYNENMTIDTDLIIEKEHTVSLFISSYLNKRKEL